VGWVDVCFVRSLEETRDLSFSPKGSFYLSIVLDHITQSVSKKKS
jgi:hypothetical protein